jgi:outer membrane protein OmpA-like peptidoglycan-associated protein
MNSQHARGTRRAVRWTPLWLALAVLAAAPITGCSGGTTTAVRSERAALGRVVVYRNGVAYYERRAVVHDDRLVVQVPSDKIDDFLKSMTVVDDATGRPLPVSFPAPGRGGRAHVTQLVVQLPPRGPGEQGPRVVRLSYVTEAAAWKPSYRVVVRPSGKVELQGWAVVDNTSKEDWRHVKVGVGSSSALAFRYDLRSIRTVHRQTLHDETRFVRAPPRGGAVHGGAKVEEKLLAAASAEQLAPPPVPPREERESFARKDAYAGVTRGAAGAGSSGRRRRHNAPSSAKAAPATDAADDGAVEKRQAELQRQRAQALAEQHERWIDALADRLRRTGQTIRVEGTARAGEGDPGGRSADRAHRVRNELIERGVAPAQVIAVGRGVVRGQGAGVRVVAVETPPEAPTGPGKNVAGADAPPVGESHFESEGPMTVAAGTSAMVSIVKSPTDGEVVYLYTPETRGGDERFAFKAVRFRNNTGSTLDPGPMTVYGAGRFIGEGMAEPIPPGALAVVPFALDRQILVERKDGKRDEIARLVKLNRGVLTAEVRHLRRRELVVHNRGTATSTVLIRHDTPRGWTIAKAPETLEQMGTSRLFAVRVEPGKSATVTIEEQTPLRRSVDLRTEVGVELVRVYLRAPGTDARVKAAMAKMLEHFDAMVAADQRIDMLRERVAELRVRLDELHGQVASLEGLRRGANLESHLQRKMKETSEAVQKATIDIVEAQEQRMVARVRFQDAVAELSLEAPAQPAARVSSKDAPHAG